MNIDRNRAFKAQFFPVLRGCCFVLVSIGIIISVFGCCKKKYHNRLELEQIDDMDNSHNDSYQFRELIEREKKEKNRFPKDSF